MTTRTTSKDKWALYVFNSTTTTGKATAIIFTNQYKQNNQHTDGEPKKKKKYGKRENERKRK